MAQLIQIKRRIPGSGPPASLAAGEPAVSITAGGVADLYIGDGTAVRDLVSADRQVEITGAQTITGPKTFSTTSLHLSGGDSGDVLTTDGTGNLIWVAQDELEAGISAVAATAPITGVGTIASPLGIEMASAGDIATGTDDVYPIDSAGLRTQLGAAASTLTTTATTIVPAINELHSDLTSLEQQLAAVAGALRFVGNFDASTSQVTTATTGTLTVGSNLPAPSSTNQGWFVIVVEDGTPSAPAPAVPMQIGDWIVSTGTSWIHVPLYHTEITAANVGITQINAQTWTNVQQALAGLYTLSATSLHSVAVDGVSIVGDGTAGDPLEVATVDGGTF